MQAHALVKSMLYLNNRLPKHAAHSGFASDVITAMLVDIYIQISFACVEFKAIKFLGQLPLLDQPTWLPTPLSFESLDVGFQLSVAVCKLYTCLPTTAKTCIDLFY